MLSEGSAVEGGGGKVWDYRELMAEGGLEAVARLFPGNRGSDSVQPAVTHLLLFLDEIGGTQSTAAAAAMVAVAARLPAAVVIVVVGRQAPQADRQVMRSACRFSIRECHQGCSAGPIICSCCMQSGRKSGNRLQSWPVDVFELGASLPRQVPHDASRMMPFAHLSLAASYRALPPPRLYAPMVRPAVRAAVVGGSAFLLKHAPHKQLADMLLAAGESKQSLRSVEEGLVEWAGLIEAAAVEPYLTAVDRKALLALYAHDKAKDKPAGS